MFKSVFSRKSIIESIFLYEKLKSYRKVARKMGISKSTIHRWCSKFHFMFAIRKQKISRKQRCKKYKSLVDDLRQIFNAHNNMEYLSVHSIRTALTKRFHYLDVPCLSSIRRAMKQLGISRRRLRSINAIKGNNDLAGKIDTFKTIIEGINNNEMMCLDETGFGTHNNAMYGYFPRGKVPDLIKCSKRDNMSCIVAISSTQGIVSMRLQREAYNKETFLAFLKDDLIPQTPENIKYILLDNVAFHHNKEAVALLESHDIKPIFIPPYSPQCNPIEEVFSLVKREFRKKFHSTSCFEQSICESLRAVGQRIDFSSFYNHMRVEVMKSI